MDIKSVLSKDLCTILNETAKNEVLFSLINMITNKINLKKSEQEKFVKDIFYREQLMSTGIGLGIGIPHIRLEGTVKPVIAVGIAPQGIQDYVSIDDEVIKIVVMIIVGKDQHKEHIRLLSIIVGMLKDESIRDALVKASDVSEIYKIFTGGKNVSVHK